MELLNERLAAFRAEKEEGRDPAVTALMNRSTDETRGRFIAKVGAAMDGF